MDTVETLRIESLTRRLEEVEAENKRLMARLSQAEAGQQLASIAASSGLLPKAIPDAVGRALASGTWKKDKSGRFSRHGADGLPEFNASGEYITLEAAVAGLRQEAPHLWPEHEPAKSPQQAPQQAPRQVPRYPAKSEPDSGDNPWLDASRNLTKQAEIIDTDPDKALRLAKAAGKPIRYGMRVGDPIKE